jgi:hypothetical protein
LRFWDKRAKLLIYFWFCWRHPAFHLSRKYYYNLIPWYLKDKLILGVRGSYLSSANQMLESIKLSPHITHDLKIETCLWE